MYIIKDQCQALPTYQCLYTVFIEEIEEVCLLTLVH